MNGPAGAIILARHGEPALSRAVRLTPKGYGDWWALYEAGGLKGDQTPPPALAAIARNAATVLTSTRRRSGESASALAPGRAFIEDPGLIEAPLPPPPFPQWVKLSPRHWGFLARVWWWFFNHHRGEESRFQAQARADAAAKALIERATQGGDVLVVAHGFFNTMVGRALRRQGWRCVKDGGYSYWSARRFEGPA